METSSFLHPQNLTVNNPVPCSLGSGTNSVDERRGLCFPEGSRSKDRGQTSFTAPYPHCVGVPLTGQVPVLGPAPSFGPSPDLITHGNHLVNQALIPCLQVQLLETRGFTGKETGGFQRLPELLQSSSSSRLCEVHAQNSVSSSHRSRSSNHSLSRNTGRCVSPATTSK